MQVLVPTVLAAWRAAERAVEENPPGTPERQLAELAAERLRELYGLLTARQPVDGPEARTDRPASEPASAAS